MFNKKKKRIEDAIQNALKDDAQANALAFVAHLRTCDMRIEKFEFHGKDKLHWEVKYKGELVCYILINAPDENFGWTIMPEGSLTSRFADYPLDDAWKEVAWNNLNICHDGNRCGSCAEGRGKRIKICGKEFDDVCGMAYNFTNPDAMALELAKKMMDIRKSDILSKEP